MTDPIAETIARVRELDEAATPGPWDSEYDGNGYHITSTVGGVFVGDHYEWYREDAALISTYRTAAPLLAAECERLRRALEDIAGYEVPTFGEVALQVCRDMRDDAFDALKGKR